MSLMQRGEMAQAGGSLARAARLIEDSQYDGVELGRLLIPDGLRALMSGDAATALATFERLAAIADDSATATCRPWGDSAGGSR